MKRINSTKFWSIVALSVLTASLYSCDKKDKDNNGPKKGTKGPTELACDFFQEDRVLVDDPDADVDYLVKCDMKVAGDIKVEPGVVIEFEQNAGIRVDDFNVDRSSFRAVGSSSKPIILRGTKKQSGYWRGIVYDSKSPINELNYVHIEDAGGVAYNKAKAGVVVYAEAVLKMENSTISNSKEYGLDVTYHGSKITLNNNKFTGNKGPAIINPDVMGALNASNDFTGNTNDYVVIESGSMSDEATTLKKLNVPYHVSNNSVYNYSGGISADNALTIEPGVVIEHDANVKWNIQENGALKAVGTASQPIIFTAINKVLNGWIGIYFNSAHPLNEIAHAQFHYSGKTTGTGEGQSGSIRLWYDNLLNIHDVTFKNINLCAINYGILASQTDNFLLTITNVTVEDAGGCLKSCYGQGCGG